jgi:hypothetical protein
MKITELANLFGQLFLLGKSINFDRKWVGLHFGPIFSPANLVTLLATYT